MEMPVLRDIENDTPTNAIDVQFNFQTIQTHLDNEVINRDGSVAMIGPLILMPGAPVSANEAVPKSYVDSFLPTGMIIDFAGTPTAQQLESWAVCDGTNVSSTDPKFQKLFGVIGTTYGTPGGGLFSLPNFKGKVSVGVDNGAPAVFSPVGTAGGKRDSELAAHSHVVPALTHTVTGNSGNDLANHHHDIGGLLTGPENQSHGHNSLGGFTGILFHDPTGYHSGYSVPLDQNTGGSGLAIAVGSLGPETFNHTHTLIGQTGGQPDNHVHAAGTLAVSNAPANTESVKSPVGGETYTDRNLQPYLTVNKLIKL